MYYPNQVFQFPEQQCKGLPNWRRRQRPTKLGSTPSFIESDPDLADEFTHTFDNPEVKEADAEFDPDSYDSYLSMVSKLDRAGMEPELARVTKRLRDNEGKPIGTANNNPIFDSRLYKVKYQDGHRAALTANTIAENVFSQVDGAGHRHILFDSILGHRCNGSQIKEEDAFVMSCNGVKRGIEMTKGWEIKIQWKDGSTT
jgi:hypothetical protein